MRLLVPFGTRPEIIKLAPVVAELRARGADVHTIATGQHYDAALTDAFFRDLRVEPDERWTLPTAESERLGVLFANAHRRIGELRPDAVVVLGDTHTVPVFSLAARQHGVAVVHVEAGLRSFNETSIEEVNRRVAASTASLHFAPTDLAASMLAREGIDAERIHIVGNPICDVLRSRGVARRPVAERVGVVVTAHRATNVDDPVRLDALCRIVRTLARDAGPVVFPVHPRTAARLDAAGLRDSLIDAGVDLLPPLPYPEMLGAMASARVVVTDSGGLQEEAAWLGVPVVVMRHSTPRWEGVLAGSAELAGLDHDRVTDAARRFASDHEQARVAALPCPYGDGFTSSRIADVLLGEGGRAALALREPDLQTAVPVPA